MNNIKNDLTNCDREPIHIPGQIQSHGFLLVVDREYIIRFHSDNIDTFIKGVSINLLGKSIDHVESILNNDGQKNFISQLLKVGIASKSFHQINPSSIQINNVRFLLIISPTDNFYLLEFEAANTLLKTDVQKMIGHSISLMLVDKKLQNLLDNSVVQVKKVIGYDRVLIYRFAEDGHGEVVAEAKNDKLETWYGLHYPASDIPLQARQLYKKNLTRIIADVNSLPSKIITEVGNDIPLDLSNAQLRAVSPIHIQYLKNMGVASSFSISLLYKNELWGLLACHNYTPRFIDYEARESSKLIGLILSSALEFMQNEAYKELQEVYKNNLDKLSKYLLKTSSIEDALTREPINLLAVVNATGAVLVYEKNRVTLGDTPVNEDLDKLQVWIKETVRDQIFYTASLAAVYPAAHAFKSIASGMMLLVLSKELEEYIIWFKPEVLRTITWAGNPDKPVEILPDGAMNISPRNSFEAWLQTVNATSHSWNEQEIKSVTILKEEVLYAINLKASAIRLLNEKLREAYEELDTFSYTISHDLKNPITAIRAYTQLLSLSPIVDEDIKKIIYRIEERADKMNAMVTAILDYTHLSKSDIAYKKIEIKHVLLDIIKDLDLDTYSHRVKITLGQLPNFYGDPVMILQLFSNLISNAVKYSHNADPALIYIEGKYFNDHVLFSIKDNGIGINPKDMHQLFGLFTRLSNAQNIEGSGVGLAIVKRIVEKHNGKIWVESEPGKGTTFFISFKNMLLNK